MAAIEQLVFGLAPGHDKGRQVLGSSPGISRECAQEIVRICEGWGAVPSNGLRRPAMLCFPLMARLSALAGELHVVVRIAEGPKPIFHALVLNRADFQEFELNPFSLAQEDVFVGKWTGDESLPRRELRPGSLAPLVSPPPGASDVGFVDEAVRQMLANQRLLLPLEHATSDSDRFLALVVAALPRILRQDLRFASWTPSGTNSYSLAATYRENALYTSWQPFLMTSVFGQLNETSEEYIEQVKVHLRSGDLAGLERHSRSARIELGRKASGSGPSKHKAVTATLDRRAHHAIITGSPPPMRAPAGAVGGKPEPTRRRAPAKPVAVSTGTMGLPRQRPRPRPVSRRTSGGTRRRFAVVLSLAILLLGAWYLWTSGHWTNLPGVPGSKVSIQTDTGHGVVDIATIYQGALKGLQQGGGEGVMATDGNDRRRGLEILKQAGQLLEVQGHDFLEEADQTLAGDDLDGVEPAPAARLHERGRVLARELRRLALAQVSLNGRIDWRDLSELESRDLEARFDSLLASRQTSASLEPALSEVDHLLRSVDIRSRQVGGLARLQELLRRERWDQAWTRGCAAAIDDLAGVRQPRARQLREDARMLLRLKRAEHSTDLAARAYRDDYSLANQLTPAVVDLLPRVHERAGAVETAPTLLRFTSNLYLDLRRAADLDASSTQRETSIRNLAENPALHFDPDVYGEHLGRLRFLLVEEAMAAGADPDSLPGVCFPTGHRQDNLDFFHARREGLDAAGWRSLAGRLREPFLVRWARRQADRLDAHRTRLVASFAEDLAALRDRRQTLDQLIASGSDATDAWRDLAAAAGRICRQYRGVFPDSTADGASFGEVVALDAALQAMPPALLVGVTVRLDAALADEPRDVVVELQAGDRALLSSDRVRLGPASPAGTGWVGSTDISWPLDLPVGTPLTARVVDAAEGEELARRVAGGWLSEVGPRELGGLDCGSGVRLSWRLAGPYWQDVALPGPTAALAP